MDKTLIMMTTRKFFNSTSYKATLVHLAFPMALLLCLAQFISPIKGSFASDTGITSLSSRTIGAKQLPNISCSLPRRTV